MTDISKCAGTGCSDKDRCYRFTAPSSNYQSWSEFWKNQENCLHYVSNSKSVQKRIAIQTEEEKNFDADVNGGEMI